MMPLLHWGNNMDFKYNIANLFQEAFGVNSPVFIPSDRQQEEISYDYSGLKTIPAAKTEGISWMRTPIVFPVTFQGSEYNRYKASGELEKVRIQDFRLPPATLFSFRRAHNITRTQVLGSNGSVKEIYGFDDWIMDVKGLCLPEPNNSSAAQMSKLLEWEKLADSFGLLGTLFDQLDINAACISNFKRESLQGQPEVIPFSFQLIADEAAELILPS